jgi:UDP-glucose 4-epimerase
MNILITGGAGFIGSHVADILAADKNNNIIIIDDLSTGKTENIPPSALFYKKNIIFNILFNRIYNNFSSK